jgi:hypothetical protein
LTCITGLAPYGKLGSQSLQLRISEVIKFRDITYLSVFPHAFLNTPHDFVSELPGTLGQVVAVPFYTDGDDGPELNYTNSFACSLSQQDQ